MPIEYAKNMKKVSVSLGNFTLNESGIQKNNSMGRGLADNRPTNTISEGLGKEETENKE